MPTRVPTIGWNLSWKSIFFEFRIPKPSWLILPQHQSVGIWNFTKIRSFNFLQFPWPRVHETSKKSGTSFFFNIHGVCTQNFTKIRHFNFLQFSWPCVDETWQKSDTSFSPIFMTLAVITRARQLEQPPVQKNPLRNSVSLVNIF